MKTHVVVFAAAGALGMLALLPVSSKAGSSDGSQSPLLDCKATARVEPATRADVEEQERVVELLTQQVAAAKKKLDGATAAHETAPLGATDGGVGGDGGAPANTSAAVAAALAEWNAADARLACEKKELDQRQRSFHASQVYSWAIEATGNLGVAEGRSYVYGGGISVSLRDSRFASEVQFGLDVGGARMRTGDSGGRSGSTRETSVVVHGPLRVYFGNSPIGLFLGAGPAYVSGHVAAIVPEGGVRLRGTPGNEDATSGLAVLDIKLFAAPWFFVDGSRTLFVFGLEVGAGGGKNARSAGEPDGTYVWTPRTATGAAGDDAP